MPEATTFADAAALLKKDSWADVDPAIVPVTTEAVDAAVEATTPAAAAPAEPAAPAETGTEGAAQPDPYAQWSVDAEGRLHRADGSYANAEEIDAYNASIPQEPTAPQETTETPQPIIVTVKGRDGSDVEIEVADEKVAEALRANARDGLRGEEYRKKMAAAEEYLAERRAFETMIEKNPEVLILQHLPEDKQASLAVALVAKHWDTIAPHLIKFDTDASTRIAEAANAQIRMRDQQRDYEQLTAQQRYGVQLESAVRALVPDGTPDDVVDDFLQVAALKLGNAVRSTGRPVPVEDVSKVLKHDLSRYGFDKPAPEPKVPAPVRRPVARAVNRPAATTAPTVTNPGATVRRTVTAQRIAAATPPQGAGAATVKAPLVPTTASIAEASQALRKQGSWGR